MTRRTQHGLDVDSKRSHRVVLLVGTLAVVPACADLAANDPRDPAPALAAFEGGGEGSVFEGFDDGFGLLDHVWSAGETHPYIEHGVVKIDGTYHGAGVMMFPGGPDAGFGNGLFEMRAILKADDVGDNSGPALVLWPGSDTWPGSEIDIGEVDSGGRTYFATHWKGDDGGNAYDLHYTPEGFNQWEWHTYAALLQNDSITYLVDGEVVDVEYDHPAPDVENGGENHLIAIMNRSSQTGIEVDWVAWTPEWSVR